MDGQHCQSLLGCHRNVVGSGLFGFAGCSKTLGGVAIYVPRTCPRTHARETRSLPNAIRSSLNLLHRDVGHAACQIDFANKPTNVYRRSHRWPCGLAHGCQHVNFFLAKKRGGGPMISCDTLEKVLSNGRPLPLKGCLSSLSLSLGQ